MPDNDTKRPKRRRKSVDIVDSKSMAISNDFASIEDEQERIACLVEQGFTPALARSVILARSKEFLPLTIWLIDNSTSMLIPDGKRLLATKSRNDVRVSKCTRWEELKETVEYHARLSALLEAPTKFVLLNPPKESNVPQEMTIGERGSEWIQEDLDILLSNYAKTSPCGATPLSMQLRRIYQSVQHLQDKIVLVIATDGRPTDAFGYSNRSVDREFEDSLRQVQSCAWVVVRLCTNDDSVLKYYQELDDQLELSLEVLDDYVDEAKEVYHYNSWLTYGLCLHRCREMGMSCHALHRWLDWLDEKSLTQTEIYDALQVMGLGGDQSSPPSLVEREDWKKFCDVVEKEQTRLTSQPIVTADGLIILQSSDPWNPIRKRETPWINVSKLKGWGRNPTIANWSFVILVVILAILWACL